jgi:hypothetical protein
MRRSTASFLAMTTALALGGCGFTPKGAQATGAGTGAGNSTGITITGAGASSGTGNSGGGNNTGNSSVDANCGAKDKPANRLPPDILLVYDASGSMNEDIMNVSCTAPGCGANSKWSVMAPAVNEVVSATQNDVNWGLKFFASDSTCGVNATANVPVGAGSAAMVATAIMGRTDAAGNVTNGSRTPTRAGVQQGAAYLNALPSDNPKYIVLVTDGLPNCPASGNSSNDDTAGAVAAVAASAASGVPVFVVGVATAGVVSNGVDADVTLNMMAAAGGRPRTGTPQYYSVSNRADLVSALTMLVGMANTCVFQIGPPPTSDGTTSTSYIDVFGDGTKIPRDTSHANGWDYVDGSNQNSIQIYGATCDAVTAGTIMNVIVTYRCVQG